MTQLKLSDTSIHYAHTHAHAHAAAPAGAPALVFVHGALCTLEDWRFQLEFFTGRQEVVALDLHGHGSSDPSPGRIKVECFARDVMALCDVLGLREVVLIGHSMGCRVLLQSWSNDAQRIKGLVFVDGAYLAPGLLGGMCAAERATLAQGARERAAEAYRDVEPAERARHGFAQMFYDAAYDALRDAIVARAMSLPPHVARELMPDFAAWDVLHLESALSTINVPMLVIASTYMNSERERVSLAPGIETPWLRAVASLAPHAEVLRYHGRGHFPMLEQPDEINRQIERFLLAHGLATRN